LKQEREGIKIRIKKSSEGLEGETRLKQTQALVSARLPNGSEGLEGETRLKLLYVVPKYINSAFTSEGIRGEKPD